MLKRLLSALIVAAMTVSCLAGCSANSPAEEANVSATSAEQSTQQAAPQETESQPAVSEAQEQQQEQSPPEPDDEDDPAQTSGYALLDYELPLFEDAQTISLWYPLRQDNVQAPEKASGNQIFWKTMQEELNIKIDFVEPGQAVGTEKYNLMVASGDMTDLIMETLSLSNDGGAYIGGYDKAIDDGIYLDLTELMEEYCPNYSYWIHLTPENEKAAYTDTGRMGAFLRVSAEKTIPNQGLGCNTEMLEASGLDIPETISDWIEMFAVLKDDVGVDYPVAINSELAVLEGGLGTAMGAMAAQTGAQSATAFMIEIETDEFVFGPTTEHTRAYIELLADFYAKGYIDPDFISAASVMDNTSFNSGKTFTTRLLQQELAQYYETFGVNVTALPAVRADNAEAPGQGLIYTEEALVANNGMAVSSTVGERLETALLVMDWFYSPDGAIMANYGIEGITFEYVDGEPLINEFYQQRTDGVFNRGIYTVSSDFGLVWPNCTITQATEEAQAAMEGWTNTEWDGYIYKALPALTLTTEESESISSKWADIDSVIDSTFLQWIVGESTLDDASWSNLIATVESLGIGDCQAAYEAAYERYQNK